MSEDELRDRIIIAMLSTGDFVRNGWTAEEIVARAKELAKEAKKEPRRY